jgi:hypothetical protein
VSDLIDLCALDPGLELELRTEVFPETFLVAEADGAWITFPTPMIVEERDWGVLLSFVSPSLSCHESCARLEVVAPGVMNRLLVCTGGRPRLELPMGRQPAIRPGDLIELHLVRGDGSSWRIL